MCCSCHLRHFNLVDTLPMYVWLPLPPLNSFRFFKKFNAFPSSSFSLYHIELNGGRFAKSMHFEASSAEAAVSHKCVNFMKFIQASGSWVSSTAMRSSGTSQLSSNLPKTRTKHDILCNFFKCFTLPKYLRERVMP